MLPSMLFIWFVSNKSCNYYIKILYEDLFQCLMVIVFYAVMKFRVTLKICCRKIRLFFIFGFIIFQFLYQLMFQWNLSFQVYEIQIHLFHTTWRIEYVITLSESIFKCISANDSSRTIKLPLDSSLFYENMSLFYIHFHLYCNLISDNALLNLSL